MDATLKIEELTALVERLKQEAQIHAQEARTANHTIAEIYQLCTGATGEPGNWNGAEPVRQTLASKEAEIARLHAEITAIIDDAEEWAKYVIEDNAPMQLVGHIGQGQDKRRAALKQPTE